VLEVGDALAPGLDLALSTPADAAPADVEAVFALVCTTLKPAVAATAPEPAACAVPAAGPTNEGPDDNEFGASELKDNGGGAGDGVPADVVSPEEGATVACAAPAGGKEAAESDPPEPAGAEKPGTVRSRANGFTS
jgi:hypothetical protein